MLSSSELLPSSKSLTWILRLSFPGKWSVWGPGNGKKEPRAQAVPGMWLGVSGTIHELYPCAHPPSRCPPLGLCTCRLSSLMPFLQTLSSRLSASSHLSEKGLSWSPHKQPVQATPPQSLEILMPFTTDTLWLPHVFWSPVPYLARGLTKAGFCLEHPPWFSSTLDSTRPERCPVHTHEGRNESGLCVRMDSNLWK